MAKSYKKNPQIDSYYDQILIGSGIGCLTTAALLSKQGFKTLILEQHYTAGGFTHVFKRKGFEWDVGIHYIGEAHQKGTAMERLFSYISDGRLEWAEMDGMTVQDMQDGASKTVKFGGFFKASWDCSVTWKREGLKLSKTVECGAHAMQGMGPGPSEPGDSEDVENEF